MRAIKSTHTKPELAVRKVAKNLGYRFRLHGKDLPGRPDLIFTRMRKVIFVNGCFWHQHRGCALHSIPSRNLDYWLPKFERTRRRDRRNKRDLTAKGWGYLVIWECQVNNIARLEM